MDERTTDILERAKLRREILRKRAQEEGIESFKFSEGPLPTIASGTDHVDANNDAKLIKPKIRRSSSFSDLTQRPVKDRLLSWKNMEIKQLENKMQQSTSRGQVCGSLTNLGSGSNQGSGSNAKVASTAQNRTDLQTASLKVQLSNQQPKKIFPSYLACDASSNIENKENTQSQRKHYFEPKFGPLTKSKLASPSSTNKTTEVVGTTDKAPVIKKLGPATLVIRDKLSKLCQESWKRNQIAEDIQRKKEDDMELLTSRWKHGFLCSDEHNKAPSSDAYQRDDATKESFQPELDENGIPLPPPLPQPGELENWKICATSGQPKNGKAKLCNDSSSSGLPQAFHPKNCTSALQGFRNPKEVPAKSSLTLKGRVKNVNFIDKEMSTPKHPIEKVTSESTKKANVDFKTSYDCNVNKPSVVSKSKLSSPSSASVRNKVQPKVDAEKFNRFPKPFSKLHLEKKFAPVKVESPAVENDSITSVDSFTENLANDFEKNLKAMGYHVEKGKEVAVELESAAETEDRSDRHKVSGSDFILRSHQVMTDKPRVQSHVVNSGWGNKTNINKVNKSSNARPISVVEHKKVVTNFNPHDVITVMKKKLVKVDTGATNSAANDFSKTQNEKNFPDNKHVQERILNKTRNSEMVVEHSSSVENNPTRELLNHKVSNDDDDDDDDDTYGLEEVSHVSSSSSEKMGAPTNKMETYFSVSEMQDQKKFNSDDVYVQMEGNQNRQSRSSSDEISEGYYAATEEDSDIYEEILDSSPLSKANCRRHVSMRRAFKSHFSDEDVSDTVASEDEEDALLRKKFESKVPRARPFTTTNASFDPPGHSSPLLYTLPSHKLASKRPCHNVAPHKGYLHSKKHHSSGNRAKKNFHFKFEEFLAPPGTLARLAASSRGTQQNAMRHHLDQFLERRGFFHPLPQDRKKDDPEGMLQNSNKIMPHPTVPVKSAKVKIQSLEELIEQEDKFAAQASNALSICLKKSHLWTDEAVECHRILLTAAKKKEILLNELKMLREGRNVIDSSLSTVAPVVGKLMITGVRLPLKPEFIAKSGTLTDTTVTYFVMTIQSGESMSSSQTFSTKDPIVLGSLEVPGQLALAGVRTEFTALLEVYALIVPRDMKSSSSKKAHAVRKAAEIASKRFSHRTDSEDEQNVTSGLRSSYFIPVGRLELNDRLINKGHFPLEGIRYPSPLQGSVHLRMKYLPETAVHLRGYLNVCLDGSREFVRKWCCLTQSEINLWRNASDELIKEPFMQIDLMSCITEQLVPVAIDYRLQKDTFEITTVTQLEQVSGRMKERMTEKNATPMKLQQMRCWFSADSAEECSSWCLLINRNLVELRTWHPYAIPSIKFKHPQVSPFTFDSLL